MYTHVFEDDESNGGVFKNDRSTGLPDLTTGLPDSTTVLPDYLFSINSPQDMASIDLKIDIPMSLKVRNEMVAFSQATDQQGCQIGMFPFIFPKTWS